MKKIIYALFIITLFSSCLNNDTPNYRFKLLPIKSSTVPASFKFNSIDTVKVKYTLPSGCYQFHSLYYQYQDTARIVAIRAIEYLDVTCTQAEVERELKFPVHAKQREDYLFKFWKGKDSDDKDIYEEKVVKVIN